MVLPLVPIAAAGAGISAGASLARGAYRAYQGYKRARELADIGVRAGKAMRKGYFRGRDKLSRMKASRKTYSAPPPASSGAGGAVTQYNDAQTTYRKRRMPRYRKRRWVRFSRKVLAVGRASRPNQQVMVSWFYNASAPVNQQGSIGCTMFGGRDIQYILSNITAWTAPSQTVLQKYTITSARMESLITNTTSAPITVDCYTFMVRKDITGTQIGTTVTNGIHNMFTTFREQTLGPLAGTSPGVTPFQNANFCKFIKILRVQKFNLQPGQCSQVDMKLKCPKRFSEQDAWNSSNSDVSTNDVAYGAYKAMGHLFIYYGQPTATDGTNASGISVECFRYYNVDIDAISVSRVAYVNNAPG